MFLKEKSASRHQHLLDPERSLLVFIDVQERFASAIADLPGVAARTALLAKASARLGIPVLATEQYPKALGKTLPVLAEVLPPTTQVFEKMAFSAFDVPAFAEAVRESRCSQVLLCGVETHVCVLQTALDALANLDAQVCVVKDAVASRHSSDRDAGLERMAMAGVHLVTAEMVVFEWLRKAGTPEFKELQALVK